VSLYKFTTAALLAVKSAATAVTMMVVFEANIVEKGIYKVGNRMFFSE
jgi:hypothetical protein